MPWQETRVVEQRLKFVLEAEKSEKAFSRLCREFGISRKSGYKWLKRYRLQDHDPEALRDESRAPLRAASTFRPEQVAAVREARKKYPDWGPRKILAWLQREFPKKKWPSASSIGRMLKRDGLIEPRRRRRRTPPYTRPFAQVKAPNQLWCVDFKGHFKTKDGTKVYPLTITDAYSRHLIRCEGLREPNGE